MKMSGKSELYWGKSIKGVIFDCDGVLLDTVKLYVKINSEILGFPYPLTMLERTSGKSELEVCKLIVNEFKLECTPEELSKRRSQLLEERAKEIELVEGVMDIVKFFKQKNIKLAVATSCFRDPHTVKMKQHRDLFDLFDFIICGDEVKQAKPAPDLFIKAKETLDKDAPFDQFIVFEDAPAGVKAANSANIPCIYLFRVGESPEAELSRYNANPIAIINSWKEFDGSKLLFD